MEHRLLSGRKIGKLDATTYRIAKSQEAKEMIGFGWQEASAGFRELGSLCDFSDGNTHQVTVSPIQESSRRTELLNIYELPYETRVYVLYIYHEVRNYEICSK